MRTTLDLDDAVLEQARAIARDRGISLGAAVSLLAERGMRSAGIVDDTGLPAFDVSPDARMLTPEMVRAVLDVE